MKTNKQKYGTGYHVMVVDDEEKVAKFICEMLKNKGYQVTSYSSSQDALNFFLENKQSIDLVITDQTMPKLTGAELAKNLLQAKPELPIFLATGFSEEVDNDKAMEIGIKEYLSKPLKLSDLTERLIKYLPEKRHSQSA